MGDVVEFDDNGTIRRAFIHYDSRGRGLGSIDDDKSSSYYWRWASKLKNPRKVGTVDLPAGICGSSTARRFAEEYFAQEHNTIDFSGGPVDITCTIPAQPEYKVGDLVEYKNGSWTVGVVKKVEPNSYVGDQRWKVGTGNHNYWPMPSSIRPLSGTYAERQAKWVEFHGIKVGSKVKVVRKNTRLEDGCGCEAWDYDSGKAEMHGGTFEVRSFTNGTINLWTDRHADWWTFPYFALEPV